MTERISAADFDDNEYLISVKRIIEDNPSNRKPLCLCIDTSASMIHRIQSIHDSITQFLETTSQNLVVRSSVKLQVITFDDQVRIDPVCSFENCEEHDLGFVVDQFRMQKMKATGRETKLGAAIEAALKRFETYQEILQICGRNSVCPTLILFSDGYATDDCYRAAERVNRLRKAHKIKVFCVGLGKENSLSLFAENGKTNYTLQDGQIREFFISLSRQISSFSRQTIMTGSETIEPPAL